MIENPILSGDHPQEDTFEPIVLGDCTNVKCNEEIYSGEEIVDEGLIYCSCHCIGQHRINEGQAVDMSKGY